MGNTLDTYEDFSLVRGRRSDDESADGEVSGEPSGASHNCDEENTPHDFIVYPHALTPNGSSRDVDSAESAVVWATPLGTSTTTTTFSTNGQLFPALVDSTGQIVQVAPTTTLPSAHLPPADPEDRHVVAIQEVADSKSRRSHHDISLPVQQQHSNVEWGIACVVTIAVPITWTILLFVPVVLYFVQSGKYRSFAPPSLPILAPRMAYTSECSVFAVWMSQSILAVLLLPHCFLYLHRRRRQRKRYTENDKSCDCQQLTHNDLQARLLGHHSLVTHSSSENHAGGRSECLVQRKARSGNTLSNNDYHVLSMSQTTSPYGNNAGKWFLVPSTFVRWLSAAAVVSFCLILSRLLMASAAYALPQPWLHILFTLFLPSIVVLSGKILFRNGQCWRALLSAALCLAAVLLLNSPWLPLFDLGDDKDEQRITTSIASTATIAAALLHAISILGVHWMWLSQTHSAAPKSDAYFSPPLGTAFEMASYLLGLVGLVSLVFGVPVVVLFLLLNSHELGVVLGQIVRTYDNLALALQTMFCYLPLFFALWFANPVFVSVATTLVVPLLLLLQIAVYKLVLTSLIAACIACSFAAYLLLAASPKSAMNTAFTPRAAIFNDENGLPIAGASRSAEASPSSAGCFVAPPLSTDLVSGGLRSAAGSRHEPSFEFRSGLPSVADVCGRFPSVADVPAIYPRDGHASATNFLPHVPHGLGKALQNDLRFQCATSPFQIRQAYGANVIPTSVRTQHTRRRYSQPDDVQSISSRATAGPFLEFGRVGYDEGYGRVVGEEKRPNVGYSTQYSVDQISREKFKRRHSLQQHCGHPPPYTHRGCLEGDRYLSVPSVSECSFQTGKTTARRQVVNLSNVRNLDVVTSAGADDDDDEEELVCDDVGRPF